VSDPKSSWRDKKCGTCEFWCRVEVPGHAVDLSQSQGLCRYGPPGLLMTQQGAVGAFLALPANSMACAQHQERIELGRETLSGGKKKIALG
jgi:hypothetical protein